MIENLWHDEDDLWDEDPEFVDVELIEAAFPIIEDIDDTTREVAKALRDFFSIFD